MALKDRVIKYRDESLSLLTDDIQRRDFMFKWILVLLTLVSIVMSLINVITKEYLLMTSTLVYAAACIFDIIILKLTSIKKAILHILFGIETLALIIFFFISGVPQGFSALWVCLIPTFALLVFGHKYGSVFSACAFLALTFCFWTPYGRSLLQWNYTEAFMLRFPVFYLADYLMSLFVEYIRRETQKRLQDSEAKYHHLYRHDFLTGLYNRYGFNERIEEILKNPTNDHLSVIIIDIDDFKGINDKYGHIMGDYILKAIANIINETICDCSLACRWGGEEFAILLNCNHEPKAIAEEIRRNIEKRAILSYGNAVWVTVSVGVCVSEGLPKKDISEILLKADNCLYESKKNGKNKVTSTSVTQKII